MALKRCQYVAMITSRQGYLTVLDRLGCVYWRLRDGGGLALAVAEVRIALAVTKV